MGRTLSVLDGVIISVVCDGRVSQLSTAISEDLPCKQVTPLRAHWLLGCHCQCLTVRRLYCLSSCTQTPRTNSNSSLPNPLSLHPFPSPLIPPPSLFLRLIKSNYGSAKVATTTQLILFTTIQLHKSQGHGQKFVLVRYKIFLA